MANHSHRLYSSLSSLCTLKICPATAPFACFSSAHMCNIKQLFEWNNFWNAEINHSSIIWRVCKFVHLSWVCSILNRKTSFIHCGGKSRTFSAKTHSLVASEPFWCCTPTTRVGGNRETFIMPLPIVLMVSKSPNNLNWVKRFLSKTMTWPKGCNQAWVTIKMFMCTWTKPWTQSLIHEIQASWIINARGAWDLGNLRKRTEEQRT